MYFSLEILIKKLNRITVKHCYTKISYWFRPNVKARININIYCNIDKLSALIKEKRKRILKDLFEDLIKFNCTEKESNKNNSNNSSFLLYNQNRLFTSKGSIIYSNSLKIKDNLSEDINQYTSKLENFPISSFIPKFISILVKEEFKRKMLNLNKYLEIWKKNITQMNTNISKRNLLATIFAKVNKRISMYYLSGGFKTWWKNYIIKVYEN